MFRFVRGARISVALASALLLGGVTACGSGSEAGPSRGSGATDATSSANGAFPVTIQHKFGSTTISAEPKRIVTVGLSDQDAVLALGKVPVGTTEWLGGYPGAIGPWAGAALGTAALPAVLKDTGTGPQMEKIAALAPDLIVALYSGLTKEQYETLSKLAPVVAQPQAYPDYGIPWQQQTEIVGRALGKEAAAKSLVQGVEARFAAAKAEHPGFAGVTAVMASTYQGIFVFGPNDNRSRTLAALGFTLPSGLDKAVGNEFGANISKERTDLIDTGAIVWIVADPAADAAKLRKDRLYAGLDVVRQGREIYVDESSDYGNAVSFVSVLSLPYTLDRLVPQLAAAIDGKTSTEVPQPAP